MPVINFAIKATDALGGGIAWLIEKFKSGEGFVRNLAIGIGLLTASLIIYNAWTSLTAFAQSKLTLAVLKTNLAFMLNPVFWIIAGIVALIAVIIYLVKAYDGWGAAWSSLIEFLKISWEIFKNVHERVWLGIRNVFLDNIAVMTAAWYKFKGLWDKDGANEGLARLKEESDVRAKELADAKAKGLELRVSGINAVKGIKLTRNNETFGSIKDGLMDKLGMGGLNETMSGETPGNTPTGGKGNMATAAVNGGPRVININGVKFADTIAIHGGSGKTAHENAEDQLSEMFLRILNSGAKMAT